MADGYFPREAADAMLRCGVNLSPNRGAHVEDVDSVNRRC